MTWHIQEKTSNLNRESQKIGLKIHEGKTKVVRINAQNNKQLYIENESLEDVNEFTYLGSIIDKTGGTDKDVKKRIQKARTAFKSLRNIWKATKLNEHTKLKLFNSNVNSILLYRSET